MDLSLRDLAERSGVSAPMLSQVERGETSPTLAVAERIAAGLELSLSQLLRLDEAEHVVVDPRAASGRTRDARRPPHRGADPAAARPARRRLAATRSSPGAATGGAGDPPMHEPGAARPPSSLGGAADAGDRRRAPRLGDGRQRHLRRRPAAPLRERGRRAGRVPGRGRRRAAKELEPMAARRCSTRSGTPTRSPTG